MNKYEKIIAKQDELINYINMNYYLTSLTADKLRAEISALKAEKEQPVKHPEITDKLKEAINIMKRGYSQIGVVGIVTEFAQQMYDFIVQMRLKDWGEIPKTDCQGRSLEKEQPELSAEEILPDLAIIQYAKEHCMSATNYIKEFDMQFNIAKWVRSLMYEFIKQSMHGYRNQRDWEKCPQCGVVMNEIHCPGCGNHYNPNSEYIP